MAGSRRVSHHKEDCIQFVGADYDPVLPGERVIPVRLPGRGRAAAGPEMQLIVPSRRDLRNLALAVGLLVLLIVGLSSAISSRRPHATGARPAYLVNVPY